MPADVVVIGSLNMDLVVTAQRAPEAGETLPGREFHTLSGGKGANQAIAAARLGCKVAMVGKVGRDGFGVQLLETLAESGVDVSNITTDHEASTGIALITVEESGQNRILIVAGANAKLSPAEIEALEELIAGAKLLIMQMEIPHESVLRALEIAAIHTVPVLLNLAPAFPVTGHLLKKVAYLVVNESEAAILTGLHVTDRATALHAAQALRTQGANRVILTLGDQGAVCASSTDVFAVPAYTVHPVDTTAAGDAFIGGFTASVLEGRDMKSCIQYANAAGALAATRLGAQASLPTKAELKDFLSNAPDDNNPSLT